MASKALPSPEALRQLLRYEPDTGRLFWRERGPDLFAATVGRTAAHASNLWNASRAGCEALTSVNNHGYKGGRVWCSTLSAHRVIWAMQTDAWPDQEIDHINNNPADNRWVNLRLADRSENCRNRRTQCNNTSGIKGVSWRGEIGRWQAQIRVSGKTKHLGTFSEIEDAAAAYAKASAELHGEFGRTA